MHALRAEPGGYLVETAAPDLRPRDALRPYQLDCVRWCETRKRAQLWVDVGLGKTAAVLTALELAFRQTRRFRALVFATKAIAQSTWQDEIEQWEHLAWLAPYTRSLVGLSAAKREELIFAERHTRVDTINYEHVQWLEDKLHERGTHLGYYYDVVICDEITQLKNARGKRFSAMSRICHPKHVPYFIGMTGTPVSEGYKQIWAPMYLVDYGHRLGYTYGQYLANHFVDIGGVPRLKQGHDEKIQKLISDVVMVLDGSDLDVLPPVHENPIRLHLPARAQAMYERLERQMFVELARGDVIAANGGVLVNKCSQLTSGAMFTHDDMGRPTRDWETVHNVKLDALDALFTELNGRNLLVAVGFTHEVERILKRYERVAVHMTAANAPSVQKAWNAGQIQMLVAHPKSCGHGLNLQAGGGDICFFTVPWGHEPWEQITGRLRRPGQKARSVGVHALLMDGTVDYDIWATVHSKAQLQDVLKRRMRNDSGT